MSAPNSKHSLPRNAHINNLLLEMPVVVPCSTVCSVTVSVASAGVASDSFESANGGSFVSSISRGVCIVIVVMAMISVAVCGFGIVGRFKGPAQETSKEQGACRNHQPEGIDDRITDHRQR